MPGVPKADVAADPGRDFSKGLDKLNPHLVVRQPDNVELEHHAMWLFFRRRQRFATMDADL